MEASSLRNGVFSIKCFIILDEIWHRYRGPLTDKDWADASGLPQPRISELRRLAAQSFGEAVDRPIGRAVSTSKCLALLRGLQSLIGRDKMRKELLDRIEKAETRKERIFLMSSLLEGESEEAVEMYLRAILKLPAKK